MQRGDGGWTVTDSAIVVELTRMTEREGEDGPYVSKLGIQEREIALEAFPVLFQRCVD